MESMIRVDTGNIVVMGGLMEDGVDNTVNAVPGLGDLPGIGNFFRNRDEKRTKTELVIFLRPTVIRDAAIHGDFAAFRPQVPTDGFFNDAQDGAGGLRQ
ncbi:MAG: hypothetical protein JNM82_10300 [Rhodocyclaceae bacterium]|nr:hypothetical protein [Rhodocyclaceae bacterium]